MEIFTKLKSAIKLKEVNIDHEIFQLHYRATSVILFASSLLVASRQHFGDPINCMSNDDVGKIMSTYCWINPTFIIASSCRKSADWDGVNAHPCVEKYTRGETVQEVRHQNYYQWVYFVLAFQAVCFYAPHLIWKAKESKLISQLTTAKRHPIKGHKELDPVVHYLYTHRGNAFFKYGWRVMLYNFADEVQEYDPMVKIFPSLTKCTFHKFGSSGDVQRHDSLCLLPLNILNEKIYIIMWFWFLILSVLTGIWLFYRALTLLSSGFRFKILERRAFTTRPQDIDLILANFNNEGDWFLLSMLARNMDCHAFKSLVESLNKRFQKEDEKKMIAEGDEERLEDDEEEVEAPSKPLMINIDSDKESDSEDEPSEKEPLNQ